MQQEKQRHGWSEQERQALFLAAEQAAREHTPVKQVFEQFAQQTGRRPNSIRNYYYMEQKRQQPERRPAFIPFDEQELEQLLEAMARGRAEGKSVRRIALELSDGDERGMLRFQNKYRSILKRKPQLIQNKVRQLSQAGTLPTDGGFPAFAVPESELSEILARFAQNIVRSGRYGQLLLISLNGLLECCGEAQSYAPWAKLTAINRAFIQQDGMARISAMEEYAAMLCKCLDAIPEV